MAVLCSYTYFVDMHLHNTSVLNYLLITWDSIYLWLPFNSIIHCLHTYVDAVMFSSPWYIVHENEGPLRVKLVLTKSATENVTIQVAATSRTATGEPCTVVPRLSGLWLSEHLVIRTVSSQIPRSKYLYQHCSFLWFTEILQIAKMATKCKCTVKIK